jgi:hypothetical protein
MKNLNEKTYDQVLTEANDYFLAQGVSVIGEGYKEVATNPALFESYVDQLTEGCSADDAANMAQIMANTNANILRESSMTGIQPVASLSMPVIRKLWPKFALKEAIHTVVAKAPRFVISYTKPYMFKGDNEEDKIYLPRGLRAKDKNRTSGHEGFEMGQSVDGLIEDFDEFKGLRKEYTVAHEFVLGAGAVKPVDFEFENGESGTKDAHVYISDTPSHAKKQPLDELVLSGILGTVAGEGAQATFTEAEDGAVKFGKRLGVYGSQVYKLADGGQLLVQFDGKEAKAIFAKVGGTGSIKLSVKAAVSSEYNEESWSVAFDIARQDVDIPTGQHLNAPLPIEALNDMMALYQIDGTKETVDLMTNVFSMKLDLEIIDFLRDSFANQPGNEAYSDYPVASEYCAIFDCKPAAGFAGSPKAWREEIKPLIDHIAQKIKNETYLQAGTFTLVANPIDVQILANVDWAFRGGAGGNVDGVAVDYSIGTYVGANAYKVVASTNVPQGAIYIVFTPSSDTQLTYAYYPYTFSTEMGYVDPNRSRVPSLMMTKRHTMFEFLPAIGAVLVKNNDGKWFNTWASSGSHYE